MAARFDQDGIAFSYPENWQLEQEDSPSGWTVSLQSPDTAFLMVNYDEEMPEVDAVAETALEALRAEYPELDAEECVESVAGQPAVGHDIRFFSLDLTNTCWSRSFYGPRGTVLLLWQASDIDLEKHEPILRAICASLTVDED